MKRVIMGVVLACVAGCNKIGPPQAGTPSGPMSIPAIGLTIDLPPGFAVRQTAKGAAFVESGATRWGARTFSIEAGTGPGSTIDARRLTIGGVVDYNCLDRIEGRAVETTLDGTLQFGGRSLHVTCSSWSENEGFEGHDCWCLPWLATLR